MNLWYCSERFVRVNEANDDRQSVPARAVYGLGACCVYLLGMASGAICDSQNELKVLLMAATSWLVLKVGDASPEKV